MVLLPGGTERTGESIMSALCYIVTFLPAGRSEPEEARVDVETGDPDFDADNIIEAYWARDDEVIHIRWSNGAGTTYHARGIDE
jgi:hypothetical protein